MTEYLTLYRWPRSQICMECDHAVFVIGEDDRIGPAAYACDIAYPNNDGVDCPKFVPVKKKISNIMIDEIDETTLGWYPDSKKTLIQ